MFKDCIKIDIENGVNLLWGEEEDIKEDILSVEECQSICQNKDGCSYFVWHQLSYQCVTMTGYGYKTTNKTCVSGSLIHHCDQGQGNYYFQDS